MGGMTFVRLAIGVPLAALVTFGLFTLMRALIFSDEVPPEEAGDALVIDILQTREESEVRTREERPEKPDEINTPPPPPKIEAAKAEAPDEGLAETLGRLPGLDPDAVDQGDVAFVVADRDEQPLVRVPPIYPPRAAERGTEGSCDITFDVNPDGSVTNADAVCTSALFKRASERAVEKWKYAPKIVDGEPQMRRGLVVTLDFNLER
jgi:protein TonB